MVGSTIRSSLGQFLVLLLAMAVAIGFWWRFGIGVAAYLAILTIVAWGSRNLSVCMRTVLTIGLPFLVCAGPLGDLPVAFLARQEYAELVGYRYAGRLVKPIFTLAFWIGISAALTLPAAMLFLRRKLTIAWRGWRLRHASSSTSDSH